MNQHKEKKNTHVHTANKGRYFIIIFFILQIKNKPSAEGFFFSCKDGTHWKWLSYGEDKQALFCFLCIIKHFLMEPKKSLHRQQVRKR